MGLRGSRSSLRATRQEEFTSCLSAAEAIAKGTGATVAAAPTWKRTLPAPSCIASPLEPPRRTVTRRGRVYLVGGDTVEVVARPPVLAPPDPTNIPSPSSLPSYPPQPPPLILFTSLLFFSSFPPLPLTVPCLLSLIPPEAKQRPVIAPRNTWYDRPDPPP